MKRTALLMGLVWASACSFPDFHVEGAASGGSPNDDEPSCEDKKRNGDETGVDCGILACGTACSVGQGCSTKADCSGGQCTDSICQAETCADQLQNGSESDQDCGGDGGCPRCAVGQLCHTLDDCDGGACTSGQCQAASCKDRLLNGDETDIDCGGLDCPTCDEGQSCKLSSDCDNVACVKDKCQPRDCSDGVKNQDETDLDCGGSCPSPCEDGLRCKEALDCESGVCPSQTLRCAAPACDDDVLNGSEPTVDCGASCTKKCAVLDKCALAEDCASSSCVSELCLPSAPTDEVLSMQGWVATASHEAQSAPAPRAIDGSLNTDWITGAEQVADMWFAVDMQQRQVFFSIELIIDNEVDNGGDAPEAVDVWLSDDGTFTTKLIKNRQGAPKLRIDFDGPQVARHIKISLSPGVSKTKWWRMDELRVRQ
jgi:hypothetical protein